MRYIGSDSRTSIGALDVDECLVLLRWETVGRLAVGVAGEAPIVVPVNFSMLDNTVVFRSGEGSMLDRVRDNCVSVQVDRFDWFRKIGWSVLVRGTAREVEEDAVAGIDLESWAPGTKEHWLQVVPDSITGRRLELNERPLNGRAYI